MGIYAVPRYAARSFVVVLPFFPTGTMERVNVEGEIATAMTFARMLSATPQAQCGHVQFVFFDIHALQQRFYFADGILPRLVSAIPLLLRELALLSTQGDRIVVAFPDDGAKKRFGPMFDGYFPQVVCQKVRDGDKRIVRIADGVEYINGSHVVLVDDLVQTGGTLVNANKCSSNDFTGVAADMCRERPER